MLYLLLQTSTFFNSKHFRLCASLKSFFFGTSYSFEPNKYCQLFSKSQTVEYAAKITLAIIHNSSDLNTCS